MNILGFSLIYRLTDRFDFSPGQIGVFIAIGQVFYFIGCHLYSKFGSVFEPIKIFPSAVCIVFFASLLVSWINFRPVIYGAYWVLMIGAGLYWPPVMAWLTAGLSGKDLNRQIGSFNRSWMGAIILGPLIAGALYKWNSNVNFLILNASYFTALSSLFMLKHYSKKTGQSLNEKPHPDDVTIGSVSTAEVGAVSGTPINAAADRAGNAGSRPKHSRQSMELDKKLDMYRYKSWINGFCSTFFLGIFGNIIPLHIRDTLGFTERSAGIMLFMRSGTSFLGFTILANFTIWHFNKRWFSILQFALLFCSLCLLTTGNNLTIFYCIAVIAGLASSGCYNNSIFYSGTTGKNPKKNLALHEIFMAIGGAAGSSSGGFIYQHFRLPGISIMMAMILLLGAGSIAWMDKKSGAKTI